MQIPVLCGQCIIDMLLILAISNGVPVLVRNMFGSRWAWPIDVGLTFFDRRAIFGHSKTWRGIASSILMTALSAPLLGWSLSLGAMFGVCAMVGDLFSSFIKRRLGYAPSSRFRLLDTIPEALFPLLLLQEKLGLTIADIGATVFFFSALEMTLSPLLYRMHIRKRPY